MKYSDLILNIKTIFKNNWTETPIQWPDKEEIDDNGVLKDISKVSEFIRLTILGAGTETKEKGENAVGIRTSVLHISVFTRRNIGSTRSSFIVDEIESLVRRCEIVNQLIFNDPIVDPVGDDGNGFYHVVITTTINSFIGD